MNHPYDHRNHNETTDVLLVAAGSGSRVGGDCPKQFRTLAGKSLLYRAALPFACHPAIRNILILVARGEEERARGALGPLAGKIRLTTGGTTRQETVSRGLAALFDDPPDNILVHDAARPLVGRDLIDRVLGALRQDEAVCPALPVVDTVRYGGAHIEREIDRTSLWRMQTPQGFRYAGLCDAHRTAPGEATDDATLLHRIGTPVRIVPGDPMAEKITVEEDFQRMEAMLPQITVVGQGYDVHRFGPGDHVTLCGVPVPHRAGLVGHSDADVALHALTDALFGALGDGDIGTHFPPSDPKWKGASSDRFLRYAADRIREAGGRILHCDVTILCEAPRIGPYRAVMLERLAEILQDHRPRLGLKATTTEKLGFVGREEGIASLAVATVRLPE